VIRIPRAHQEGVKGSPVPASLDAAPAMAGFARIRLVTSKIVFGSASG
jgi:hypothetical protein